MDRLVTTDLPLSDGPYIFNGLPGLIISIQDIDNEYSFNLIQVKKSTKLFDARVKTVKIGWKEYETLAKSYYNDPYDLNSKAGMKVMMTDPAGNKLDVAEMNKEIQKYILQENNPIEIIHKVQYQ